MGRKFKFCALEKHATFSDDTLTDSLVLTSVPLVLELLAIRFLFLFQTIPWLHKQQQLHWYFSLMVFTLLSVLCLWYRNLTVFDQDFAYFLAFYLHNFRKKTNYLEKLEAVTSYRILIPLMIYLENFKN